MRSRVRVAVLTAALMGQGVIAVPASAAEHPRVDVVAEGLDNPRGIAIDDDGTLYVAEAGVGGDDKCITLDMHGEEAEVCLGDSSVISSIATDGTVTTAVDGLPSFMAGEGEYVGASGVDVAADGSLYVTVSLGGDTDLRALLADGYAPGALLGTVQHAVNGTLTELADLAQWEAENDPNAGSPSTLGPEAGPSNDSNPNAVLVTSDGGLYAADAGGNTVLEIDPTDGSMTLAALSDDRLADAPPFLGLPPGTQIPMQSVPTGLTEGPDGEVVFGELTGFPFPMGGAAVWALTDTTTPALVEDGFTNVMDVAFLGGDVYVLELSHTGLLSGSMEGALVRVRADGTRTALLRDVLVAPGGLVAGDDGMLYITNNSVGAPGSGTVLRFDPSQAADAAIASACPPLDVPGVGFSDIADTTHEETITCAAWYGVFLGFDDDTFRPQASITRGQFAATAARLIREAGAALPDGGAGVFPDVDATTHAGDINALAAVDIVAGFDNGTYRPGAAITRAQATTILVGVYEYVTGAELPAGADAFEDDDGSTHESAINAAAAMDWIRGTAPDAFAPGNPITRGQVASVLMRMAADLADAEFLGLPG